MNKYAAYVIDEWVFDVHADTETEALDAAKRRDVRVSHVELVSETGGRGAA
jgi:hypothetical protein